MPGTRITEEDRKRIDRKFICTICNLLLCKPMQTHCGHLMCFACLQTLLEGPNSRCPEDGTELAKEQVFPDVFTKRELNGLNLHCINQDCPWHGTYEALEEHSTVCEHALINCIHSQCKMKFQRSHQGKHLKSECEYRNVKCDFCVKDVTFASMKEHVDTSCEGAPVTCRYCMKDVLRKDIERHERRDCDEVPATCEFQAVGCNHDKALYVLALFIASFGALLFLLIVVYYTCCYCACRQTRERRQNESCCCAKTSLQLQVFMLALICCGALTVGFVFNGKTSEGVDQFRNSVDDIQDDINYASTMGNQMEATLQNTKSDISVLYDDTRSAAVEIAITLSEMLINNLIFVNNQLPESVVNESGNVGDKVHRYDNYRWLATVILLSWCIFLCIFLFWIGCQVNGCILVMASMFCLLTVLFTWTVVGADVGVATGIGDFCVHPKQAIRKIKKGDAFVISYYMDCNGYDPFGKNLSELQADSKKVMDLIASVPVAPEYQYLKNRIVTDMTSVNNNLRLYQASFTCDKIHKEYMDAMDGLCEKTLNSLAIVILAVLVIAVFSGLLTCCTCPLWKHRRPYPTTYNDIRSPPDDVGNAVLWWPHDVDAESDRSFHQRHSDPNEQSPLIANQQHYPEYQGGNQAGNQVGDQVGNQANLNFIHVNYHGIPPRAEERQASGRHSF